MSPHSVKHTVEGACLSTIRSANLFINETFKVASHGRAISRRVSRKTAGDTGASDFTDLEAIYCISSMARKLIFQFTTEADRPQLINSIQAIIDTFKYKSTADLKLTDQEVDIIHIANRIGEATQKANYKNEALRASVSEKIRINNELTFLNSREIYYCISNITLDYFCNPPDKSAGPALPAVMQILQKLMSHASKLESAVNE